MTEDTAFHYHEFHKIVFFLSGKGNYLVGGHSYVLKPNDIVLVQRGEIHKADISSDYRYERVIIYIDPDFLSQQSSSACNLDQCFRAASQNRSFVIRPDMDLRDSLYRELSALEDATQNDEFGHDLLARSLLMQILIELTRGLISDRYRYAPAESGGEKIASILEYLHEHLTEEISIDQLADTFYLSKYHMMRSFRARTGFTIHGYLTDKRLHLAREMIAQGETALEACYGCGYKDYSAFSRAYKKRFQETPCKIRGGRGG